MTVTCYVLKGLQQTQLSPFRIFRSLCDPRAGVCIPVVSPSQPSDFQGTTAVVVGDLGEISLEVASQLLRRGSKSLHLVGAPSDRTAVLAGLPKDVGTITRHTVDFSQPGEVVAWCRSACELFSEHGRAIDVLVLGPTTVMSNVQRLTRDGLDSAFTADVVGLQALLTGLRPVLAPRARIVVTVSAACCWLSRLSHEGLREGDVAGTCWLDGLEARAQQQAARVLLANYQAHKWATEEEGPVCVCCTPTGCWSAWTDLLVWAGLFETWTSRVQGLVDSLLLRKSAAWAQSAATARVASTVVHLCRKGTSVESGDYYWGRCRVRGLRGTSRAALGADLERMFVVLALRSGQLPG